MTAGAGVDDSGKVPRKIVSVTIVSLRKRKWNLQGDLGCTDCFTVFPCLTINRDLTARGNCIEE